MMIQPRRRFQLEAGQLRAESSEAVQRGDPPHAFAL